MHIHERAVCTHMCACVSVCACVCTHALSVPVCECVQVMKLKRGLRERRQEKEERI